jgi:hypothetical protein
MRTTSLLLLLAAGIAMSLYSGREIVGQEVAEAAPISCEWQLSGETAADFRAEVVPSRAFDQSTPENTVKSFLAVAGGALVGFKKIQEVDAHVNRVISNELRTAINHAVTDEVNDRLDSPSFKMAPSNPRTSEWVVQRLEKPKKSDDESDNLDSIRSALSAPFAWRDDQVQIIIRRGKETDPRYKSEPAFGFLCTQSEESWFIADMRRWALVTSRTF